MLPTRRIGNLLRGNATPFQLFTGALLGALLGWMPGFGAAPGLWISLTLLLVLLNANLILAALVGIVAKLLSLVALPLTFAAGRLLLDGPTSGVFQTLINAPVFALFGFENYVATGSLLTGGLFGALAGAGVVSLVSAFRRKMRDLGAHNTRYQDYMARGWVRWLVFILVGGGLKDPDYDALLAKKVGNPIRPLGAAFVVLSAVLLVVTYQFFAATIVTTALRGGLETANGATVDLDSAELDLRAGRLTLTGLAVADPNALGTDLFRAATLEADVSGVNLPRKRLQLDRVIVADATSGEPRRVPGRRLPGASKPREPITWPDAETLEDYLANAQVWRERLAQAKSWLDRLHGTRDDESTAPDGTPAPAETLGERLAREAAARGYAQVTATHLVTGAPTLLITEITAAGVTVAQLPGEKLTIVARHLSTQPALVAAAPSIEITSASDRLGFNAALGAAAATPGRASTLAFHYRGVPVDDVAGLLARDGRPAPIAGGTVDFAGTANYAPGPGTIDLPLNLTLRDTTVTVAGRANRVSNFSLPVGVSGPLDSPALKIEAAALTRLAGAAGRAVIEDKAREAVGERAGGLLEGFLGGRKKE